MVNQKNNQNSSTNLTDSFQKLSKLSLDFLSTSFENNLKIVNEMGNLFKNVGINIPPFAVQKNSDCCPPEPYCPPHCLIEINKEAYAGEVIVVPFSIKNTCGSAKHYRIGLRPMVDQDGNRAPVQPVLNKNQVDLQSGQYVNVLMTINLLQGVKPGDCFQTDIVIREKDVNQNICFKLKVNAFCDLPVAMPLDEKIYLNQWQSWRSHFYCEQKSETGQINTNLNLVKKE